MMKRFKPGALGWEIKRGNVTRMDGENRKREEVGERVEASVLQQIVPTVRHTR
jgi:hypothetical protein